LGLVAIDPGTVTGFASFRERVLVSAGFGPFEVISLPLAPRVVLEVPRVYPVSKGDPNDLITLAMIAGEIRHRYRVQGIEVREVWPRTWKGNVPKDVHHKRVLKCLSAAELVVIPKRPRGGDDHNCLDAIGLGLWALERM
jgi:hypothetical protein